MIPKVKYQGFESDKNHFHLGGGFLLNIEKKKRGCRSRPNGAELDRSRFL